MSARDIVKTIIEENHITQVELADRLNVTKQNFFNKMKRDNFSALELVEIADALNMKLAFLPADCDGAKDKVYVIDYPTEQKGKPKRKSVEKGN